MEKKQNLVLGLGEVGTALRAILECDGHDPFKDIKAEGEYEVLHVAIPYNNEEQFTNAINEAKEKFNPDIIVNHSSVPVGTSRKLGMVHSPIRGVHPHLEEGIRTMTKFFGGENKRDALIASSIFSEKGLNVLVAETPEDTEAAKLWSTTGYGLNIILEKYIAQFCKENNLDFDIVYTAWNETYNQGYANLGLPHFCKYILKHMEGAIGGHCIMPNIELLRHPLGDFIKEKNDELKGA